jgi:PEP-CTERM motif-containing protein
MKFLRPALIVALLCVATAGAAFADDIHVIFDPGGPGTINFIQDPGVPYVASWEDCGSNGIPNSLHGNDACLAFFNETGGPITDINFTFTVNAALAGQTIGCDNLPGDPHLSSNTCSSVTGELQLGQVVSVDFFGGVAIPDNVGFFLAEDGVSLAAGVPDFTAEVPEPSSLTLMAAGIGLLGLGLVLTKR